MKYLIILYWNFFCTPKIKLFLYFRDNEMDYNLAFKKVLKMSPIDCIKYIEQEEKISRAYKQGYSDGDYWNKSQNPYTHGIEDWEWKEYELGFNQCKKDKEKNWNNEFRRIQ